MFAASQKGSKIGFTHKQKANFKVALDKHENKFKNDMEKVQKWRTALSDAASMSGWHYEDGYVSNN